MFFVNHVFPFGLATAPGVQGCIADVTVDILEAQEIAPVFMWVDNFNFMCRPCKAITQDDGSCCYYPYDLTNVIACMDKLGNLCGF